MSQNFGPQVVPHKGFVYNVRGQFAEGFDRDSLIQALTDFRISNRLTIGNPEKDVDEHLSAKSPSYIPPMSKGRIIESRDKPKTLLDRVKAWLVNRKYGKVKIKYVDRREADRRAAICSGCKENRQWRSSCAPCVRAIEHDVVIVSQNRQSAFRDRLYACNIAGHDNSVAVFLAPDSLMHSRAYTKQLPRACWMLSLTFDEPKQKPKSAAKKLP